MDINKDINNDILIDLPNNVHNEAGVAEDGTKVYLGSQSLTWDANQRKQALQSKAVKPAMAYSQEEFVANEHTGLWATQKTVENQVKQRQDMPKG